MKITADTNVLVRIVVHDDAVQARAAQRVFAAATLIAVPTPVLCELVWVLKSVYRLPGDQIVLALRTLLSVGTVAVDRETAEAGIAVLEAGGDFADGAIAHDGTKLGADTFVSFDRKATTRLAPQGFGVNLLT